MIGALSRWLFYPQRLGTPDGEPVRFTTKMTYYFLELEGKSVVLDPLQTPYVGPSDPYQKKLSVNKK